MYLRAATMKQQQRVPRKRMNNELPSSRIVVPENRSQETKDFELFVGSMLGFPLPPPPPQVVLRQKKIKKQKQVGQLKLKVSNPPPTIITTSPSTVRSSSIKKIVITNNNSDKKKKVSSRGINPKGLRLPTLLEERDEVVPAPVLPTVRLVTPEEAASAVAALDAPFGMEDLEVVDVEAGPSRKEKQEEEEISRKLALAAERHAEAVFHGGEYETRRCGPKFKTFPKPELRFGKPYIQNLEKPSLVSSLFSTDATTELEDDPNLPRQHIMARRTRARPPLPKSQSLSFLFTLGLSRHRVDPSRSRSSSLPSLFRSSMDQDKSKVVGVVSSDSKKEEHKLPATTRTPPVTHKSTKLGQGESEPTTTEEEQQLSTGSSSFSDDEPTPTLSRTTSYSSIGSDYIPLDPHTPYLLKPTSKRRQVEFTPPSRPPPPPPLPYADWERELSKAKKGSKVGKGGGGKKRMGLGATCEEPERRRRR